MEGAPHSKTGGGVVVKLKFVTGKGPRPHLLTSTSLVIRGFRVKVGKVLGRSGAWRHELNGLARIEWPLVEWRVSILCRVGLVPVSGEYELHLSCNGLRHLVGTD